MCCGWPLICAARTRKHQPRKHKFRFAFPAGFPPRRFASFCYNHRLPLRLYNTLSGKVEEFSPEKDNTVRMYACGPTVYDYGHIGNFRTFVAVDILRRFLRQSGFKLQHVMNITDVDDKI